MLGIKLIVNNLFYLSNLRKLGRNLVNPKSMKDNFMFAVCFALINSTYKLVLCLLRRQLKDDRINSIVAALFSALWIQLEPPKRRSLIVILLLSRAFASLARIASNAGLDPGIPHFDVFIAVLAFVQQQWLVQYETESLNPGQYRFLHKWGFW